MTPITSEDHILRCMYEYFPKGSQALLVDNGDDCCVLHNLGPLCVSTDLFMEDAHFRRAYFSPEDVGYKALAVNVSDLAACGALPVGFSLGLALPDNADMELVHGLFAGMKELAAQHDMALTGGDLSRGDKLHLCVTVFGLSEAPHGALLRRQARPGDTIFLLGNIGLARAGLQQLEARGRAALADYPQACAAHLRPVPKVREGLRLAALAKRDSLRLSLMDVSDGLARDLPRLLGPEYGARITLSGLHSCEHPEIVRHVSSLPPDLAKDQNTGQRIDPALFAFQGGEDYALVGTCPAGHGAALMAVVPEAVILGTVTDTPGLWCNGQAVLGGFDHFSL